VSWLHGIFQRLLEDNGGSGRDSSARKHVMDDIRSRFYRPDETPVSDEEARGQQVSAFVMHRLPTLHRWYFLFAGGHRHVVACCLKGIGQSRRLPAPSEPPPDDHPVIYISWYDAWAFCQWTNWRDPGTGVRHGLRLPHEPEWEYAARWMYGENGKPVATPRACRWWWGDDFYAHEDRPEEEDISEPHAHADGRPGQTRAPALAQPNGLGFHDIVGNVWEWTANLYDLRREKDTMTAGDYTIRYSRFDPKKRPPVNGQRSMRGGLWYYLNILATCSNRWRYVCSDRDYKMGFRVVRELRKDRGGAR
jgi:formylglycine-generating enzyme required for sulfatase activity